jgi:hypothetical protein
MKQRVKRRESGLRTGPIYEKLMKDERGGREGRTERRKKEGRKGDRKEERE